MIYAFRQGLICLLLLWLPATWAAESGWLRSPENDHASVRLRADTSAQDETRLLIDIKLENGWKTYWRSPGEGGVAPSIAWKGEMPAVDWFWPTPARFDVAGITTQGYHQQVTFPLTVRGPAPDRLAGVADRPPPARLACCPARESPRAVPPYLLAVALFAYGAPPRCCGL